MTAQTLFMINIVLSLVAILLTGYALLTLYKLRRLKRELTDDGQETNLEAVLTAVAGKIKRLETRGKTQAEAITELQEFSKFTIHKIGTNKFNALADEGGNMSFTLALLDAHDSGVVVTSINGRTQNRVYAKPIQEGQSSTQLTEEEQAAIVQAKKTAHKKTVTKTKVAKQMIN